MTRRQGRLGRTAARRVCRRATFHGGEVGQAAQHGRRPHDPRQQNDSPGRRPTRPAPAAAAGRLAGPLADSPITCSGAGRLARPPADSRDGRYRDSGLREASLQQPRLAVRWPPGGRPAVAAREGPRSGRLALRRSDHNGET